VIEGLLSRFLGATSGTGDFFFAEAALPHRFARMSAGV
jgi:hypothetical protein